jgi:hypothetical protein
VTSVITNFHHRRIIPLMEWKLRIYEMNDAAEPVSLACSLLLQERLSKGTRPRGRGTWSTSRWCRTTMTTFGCS